jgi:hypothetical protein
MHTVAQCASIQLETIKELKQFGSHLRALRADFMIYLAYLEEASKTWPAAKIYFRALKVAEVGMKLDG